MNALLLLHVAEKSHLVGGTVAMTWEAAPAPAPVNGEETVAIATTVSNVSKFCKGDHLHLVNSFCHAYIFLSFLNERLLAGAQLLKSASTFISRNWR